MCKGEGQSQELQGPSPNDGNGEQWLGALFERSIILSRWLLKKEIEKQ